MEFNCSILQGKVEYVFVIQETLQSNTFVNLIVWVDNGPEVVERSYEVDIAYGVEALVKKALDPNPGVRWWHSC